MDKLIDSPHFTVWQLIKTYWQSEHRLKAYIGYSILVLLTIIVVCGDLAFNYWYNFFYTALQNYNEHAVVRLLSFFFILAFAYIAVYVVRFYLWQTFGLRWRRWLTEQLIGRWLKKRGYYYLENFDVKTDNPDQRIQDDVGALISNSIDLSLGLIANILSVIGFGYVLWTIPGDELAIPFGNLFVLHIHGYLMWIAIVYSLVGTLFAFKVGRPLVPLNFEQQSREATFRFAAIDLRSHAEHVALYRGEQHQKNILRGLFGRVLENMYAIIVRQTKLLSFSSTFSQLAVALPLIVVVPLYFKKAILLGGLIQSLGAFNNIQSSLSFIVNSFSQIAVWRATGQRLTTFLNHLNEMEESVEKESGLVVTKQGENEIATKQLTIKTPRNEVLLDNIDMTFVHGNNYLIKGVSGLGKSTFIRVMAGIWPFASGNITLPEKMRIMFLPQKPYMPIGTLAEAILFPDHSQHKHMAKLETVLRDCNLESFIPRLQEKASWSEQLSPGEQQRIAFARVLMQEPGWVFLDESTSMLDMANEAHLYAMLKEKLPMCSLVSVGHRTSLEAYHDHVIDMARYGYQKEMVI